MGRRGGTRRQLAELIVWLVVALQTACGTAEDRPSEPVLVMAAASLNEAMPDLIDAFEHHSDAEVEFVLGSTGSLAAQIDNGAPGDLFFAADQAQIERLAHDGPILPESVVTFATGRLALVWPPETPGPATLEAIAGNEYRTIAIANPEHAPYGLAARQTLQGLGLWDDVSPRLVQGENVAQTYQFVLTGNTDLALVAHSVVDTTVTRHLPIPPDHHQPIRHSAGILQRSRHSAAPQFLEFVMGDEGQEILASHRFGRASD